jgi:hypothetical protein
MHYFEIKNVLQIFPLSRNTQELYNWPKNDKNLILNQYKDLKLDSDSTSFF